MRGISPSKTQGPKRISKASRSVFMIHTFKPPKPLRQDRNCVRNLLDCVDIDKHRFISRFLLYSTAAKVAKFHSLSSLHKFPRTNRAIIPRRSFRLLNVEPHRNLWGPMISGIGCSAPASLGLQCSISLVHITVLSCDTDMDFVGTSGFIIEYIYDVLRQPASGFNTRFRPST